MEPISHFTNFVKSKIEVQLPPIQQNLLSASYPTAEQTQTMSGICEGIKSVYDSMDRVIEKFKKDNPNIEHTIEAFVPFLQQEIASAALNIRGLTHKNQGIYQGLMSISDSLESLQNEHEDLLNNKSKSPSDDLVPLECSDETPISTDI